METPNHSTKSYKFDFWKDRFWIWALCLPIGLISWAVPFVLFFGLSRADNAPGWFPIFGFVFLGVLCFPLGWVFVYSLMEGFYTKVTITDDWVSIRLPWLIFPLIPIVKRIELERIRRINLFAPYGTRAAVFLYYYDKKKERHFYLPKFVHNPPYLKMMLALKDRIEPPPSGSITSLNNELQGKPFANEAPSQAKRYPRLLTRFIDNIMYSLISLSMLAMVGIGGWITLSLPASSKVDAFSAGFGLSFVCFWLAFCGFLPVGIGQVAFWFLGHPIIRAILWLFQVPDVSWETPPVINQLLTRWNIPPVHSTLVEFLFWAILIISIELSITGFTAWLRRRASK